MGDFLHKCRCNIDKAVEQVFINNVANIAILVVALLLVISLMTAPSVLTALALFGLFLCAILYGCG